MTKLTTAIINSSNGLNSGTYVVEDTISLSQDLTIPEDVTLIFQGGKFETNVGSGVTISGSNTRLDAPICTIFGKKINIEGSWNIDRAYPQWFELGEKMTYIAYNNDTGQTYTEDFYDWSTPINNAIKMKQVGEVFLINGDYSIASPIEMNCRIHLVGESSQYEEVKKVTVKTTTENEQNDVEKISGCARIFPVAEGKNPFSSEYLLYVNSDSYTESTIPGNEYIVRSTLIKNIYFTNWIKKSDNEKLTQKCILAGGGVHLDRVVWNGFLQAVKYTHTYNDGRCITNCVFSTDTQTYEESDKEKYVYAIDTEFLGDGMKFELNGIANTANGKALRISNCGGATIQSNVINGDILIHQSKAIVFNANHCENGIQIEIIDSCVSTQNNYIWKGVNPTYFIHSSGNEDKSVVSLNNDMFIYINDLLDKDKTLNDFALQLRELSEYDIKLDKYTILNLENIFRYDIGKYGFGKMSPFGISIQKSHLTYSFDENVTSYTETVEDFNEFNKFSYSASCKSQILSNFNLKLQETIKQVNSPSVYGNMLNEGVFWLEEIGNYSYYYQILWDKDRGIKKSSSSNSIYKIQQHEYEPSTNEFVSYDSIDIIASPNSQGVLIILDENVNGNHTMIRLFRVSNINNIKNIKYVDIPMCGSKSIFDNGISVCGYKWKSEGATSMFLQNTSDKNVEMFKICDGNVECFIKQGNNFTLGSGWKLGDVIHSITNNTSTYIDSDNLN